MRSEHLYCKDKGDDKAILSVSAELARERRAPCGFSNLTGRIAITGCRSCVISSDLLSNLECAHKTQQLSAAVLKFTNGTSNEQTRPIQRNPKGCVRARFCLKLTI